jgi:hypothetical protein
MNADEDFLIEFVCATRRRFERKLRRLDAQAGQRCKRSIELPAAARTHPPRAFLNR